MWEDSPFLRVELPSSNGSDSVVVFTQLSGRGEMHTPDWHLESLGELNPYSSDILISVRVICVSLSQTLRRMSALPASLPTATEVLSAKKFVAAVMHLSL